MKKVIGVFILLGLLNLSASDDHMKDRKLADLSAKKLSLKLQSVINKSVKEALSIMAASAKNSKMGGYAKNDTDYWLNRDYMLDADNQYCLRVSLTAAAQGDKRGMMSNYSVSPTHIGISAHEYVCYLLKSGAQPIPANVIEQSRKEADISAEELSMRLDGFSGDIKEVEDMMKKEFGKISLKHDKSYYLFSPYKDYSCVGVRLAQNIHTKKFTVTNSPRVYNIAHQQCFELYNTK